MNRAILFSRIASDWERKEELGVEKDVWRSKFLASTVIVDDLTRTKQTCVQRMEDLEHGARRLGVTHRSSCLVILTSLFQTSGGEDAASPEPVLHPATA